MQHKSVIHENECIIRTRVYVIVVKVLISHWIYISNLISLHLTSPNLNLCSLLKHPSLIIVPGNLHLQGQSVQMKYALHASLVFSGLLHRPTDP